jgi:chemotaxis protein CheC
LDDLRQDILNEVGNIGAAHAATAMGQLLERTIMISVPKVSQVDAARVPALAGDPEALVAGVSFHVVGDASGRILLWLPRKAAVELVDVLLRNPAGTTKVLNDLGHSTVKETGNIMASAYLNGLSEFCGLLLLPSVPNLAFDISQAVLEQAAEGVERLDGKLLVIENGFEAKGTGIQGRIFFLVDGGSEAVLAENASGAL